MYQALLMAPDGEYVTDHQRETVAEVWDAVNDQGSRWVFYPFAFVVSADAPVSAETPIVEAFDGWAEPDGMTLLDAQATVCDYVEMQAWALATMERGLP